MSRRSQNRNQYETTTVEGLAIGAFSVTVVSVAGLTTDQDMYLVIEPDTVGQREWLKIVSITGNTLNIQNPNGRNLTGSDGDLKHDAGSVIRSVPSQQIFEDIFQDAEDDELDLVQHETDGGDPHATAGYLKQADTDPLYVNISGDTMDSLAQISVDTSPSDPDHLTRKGYVDDNFLDLTGTSPMTGALQMGTNKITGLGPGVATGEAVEFDAMETAIDTDITTHAGLANVHHTKTADQTFLHDDLTDVSTSQHHVKFSDTDAEDAIAAQDIYYTKTEVDALFTALTIAASQVTSGEFVTARIPSLATSKITSGEFTLARIPNIPAADVIAGTFSGVFTFTGSVGIAGPFNANSSVDFSGLPIDAGGVALRLIGNSVRKAS